MNIGPFASREEELTWRHEFVAAIEKGVELSKLMENINSLGGPCAKRPLELDVFAIKSIQRVIKVLSLIRHALADQLTEQEANNEIGETDHISSTIDAATFMIESVEDELSAACVSLMPSDKLRILTREMTANGSKAGSKKI